MKQVERRLAGAKRERSSAFVAANVRSRLFIDAVSLRVSAVAMSVVMVLMPTLTFAQSVPPSVPAGAINIVPDGRTATTVTTNGSVGTVTTNTISGPNAFNSFSQFQVGRGATGNLMVPNGTSNLINLLNSSDPAVINGVVNSYKDVQIGGNVYFAAPGGFVVGSSGTVNVGSLNVSTPTREFVDGVISRSGQINQNAVDNLLAGTVPISPDGNIRIRGRVNAVDAVRLTGQNVFVGEREAANRDQAAKFASTVNSKGLQSGSKIVVRNGSIEIVAANDAAVNGHLAAKGGSVSAKAGRNVEVGNQAKVSVAAKNANGGSIAVNAGQDIKVAGYGVLSAKSVAGNGVRRFGHGLFRLEHDLECGLGVHHGRQQLPGLGCSIRAGRSERASSYVSQVCVSGSLVDDGCRSPQRSLVALQLTLRDLLHGPEFIGCLVLERGKAGGRRYVAVRR